jgi:hypothetical protein
MARGLSPAPRMKSSSRPGLSPPGALSPAHLAATHLNSQKEAARVEGVAGGPSVGGAAGGVASQRKDSKTFVLIGIDPG